MKSEGARHILPPRNLYPRGQHPLAPPGIDAYVDYCLTPCLMIAYCHTPCLMIAQQKEGWNKVGLTVSQWCA